MVQRIFITMCAIFLAASFAWAGNANMKEGNWEVTTVIKYPDMGMVFPPFTFTQCLTAKDIVPQSDQPGYEGCKVKNSKISGNTVTWEIDCKENNSGYTSGNGSITYAGTTLKGMMSIKGAEGAIITGEMSGKYLGPCK